MVYEKSPSEDRPKPLGENLAETVGAKEDRKLRSRREQDRNLWSWLGMMGLVGWAVAVTDPGGHRRRNLDRYPLPQPFFLDIDASFCGSRTSGARTRGTGSLVRAGAGELRPVMRRLRR